jgi:voltage-gated potassium channel
MDSEGERLTDEEPKIKKNLAAKKVTSTVERTIYAPYYVLKKLRVQLMLLGVMFVIGAVIFMWYQGLDFLSALLGSVSTITTIGIYAPNIVLMDNVEKIVLVIVFIVSVGIAASYLQGTIAATIKSGLMTDDLVRRMARRMENHVIVVGYKFLGKYVVESLQALGIGFLVVSKYRSQLDILRTHNIPALYAPITHVYEALKEANVEKASTLVSTMDSDGENMLTVLTAKKLNNNIKTISIVNDRELVKGVKSAGADVAIPYLEMMGRMLAMSSLSREAGIIFTDNLKLKHIVRYEIETPSMTYADIKGVCPILMISRSGELFYDMKDDFQLKVGDTVYALVDPSSVRTMKEKLKLSSVVESAK